MAYKNTPLTGLSVKQIQILVEARNKPGVHTYYPAGYDVVSFDYCYDFGTTNKTPLQYWTKPEWQNVFVVYINSYITDTRVTFATRENRIYLILGSETRTQLYVVRKMNYELNLQELDLLPHEAGYACFDKTSPNFHVVSTRGFHDYVEVTVDGVVYIAEFCKHYMKWTELTKVWVKNYSIGTPTGASVVTEAHCVTVEENKNWEPTPGLRFPMPGVVTADMRITLELISKDDNPPALKHKNDVLIPEIVNKKHVKAFILIRPHEYIAFPLITREEFLASKGPLKKPPIRKYPQKKAEFDIKDMSLADNTSAVNITFTAIEWRKQEIFDDTLTDMADMKHSLYTSNSDGLWNYNRYILPYDPNYYTTVPDIPHN